MLPDAGIAGPVASANAALRGTFGCEKYHMVLAPPRICLRAGCATRDTARDFRAWQQ